MNLRRWWLCGAGGLLGGLLFLLVRNSLGDDAYITLAYARNVAVRGERAIVPGQIVNSATSPLNVLTLALFTLLSRISGGPHTVLALGLQTVLVGGLFGWGWQRLTRTMNLPSWFGLLGLLVVLGNPLVGATLGLEVVLIPTTLLWLVVAAMDRRPVLYGLVAAAAVLTRIDLIVFVVIIALASDGIRRRFGLAFGVGVVTVLPWFAFSWIALGSFIPDTLVIKQSQGSVFGQWDFSTGLVRRYMKEQFSTVTVVVAALVGAVAALVWIGLRFSRRWDDFPQLSPVVGLAGGGVAYYVVYSMLGVGPFPWYYVPPLSALAMAAVLLVGSWYVQTQIRPSLRPVVPMIVLAVLAVNALSHVVIDLQPGVPWPSSRKTGNWASAGEYARIGRDLGVRLNGQATSGPGEIGTLAYFCECQIYDAFSERGRTAKVIRERLAESSPVGAALLRFNYAWFDLERQPLPVQYNFRWKRGQSAGPDTWNVSETYRGRGYFALTPAR